MPARRTQIKSNNRCKPFHKTSSYEKIFMEEGPQFGIVDCTFHYDSSYVKQEEVATSIIFDANLHLFLEHCSTAAEAETMLSFWKDLSLEAPESVSAILDLEITQTCCEQTGLFPYATAIVVEHFDLPDATAVILMGSIRGFGCRKKDKTVRPFIILSVVVYKKNAKFAVEYHCNLIDGYISEMRTKEPRLRDRFITCTLTDDNDMFSQYSQIKICISYGTHVGYGEKLFKEASECCSEEVLLKLFGRQEQQFLDPSSFLHTITEDEYDRKRIDLADLCDPDDPVEQQFIANHAYEIYQQFSLQHKLKAGFCQPFSQTGYLKQLTKRLDLSQVQMNTASKLLKTISELAEQQFKDIFEATTRGPGRYTCHIRPHNYQHLNSEEQKKFILQMGLGRHGIELYESSFV